MGWTRVLIGVIAVLSLSIVTGSGAHANSFGPVFADNGSHTFFYDDDIGSTRRSAMESARINALDGPTVMTTSRKSTYTTLVDVWVYGEWSPSGDETGWYSLGAVRSYGLGILSSL